jgi:DNA-binding XRE family transcriptional regulator
MTKIPRLFELMDERNVKAKKLAEDLGISSGNISDWKSGRSQPNPTILPQLADYFGVTTDYLLGAAEKPKNDISGNDFLVAYFKGCGYEGTQEEIAQRVAEVDSIIKTMVENSKRGKND